MKRELLELVAKLEILSDNAESLIHDSSAANEIGITYAEAVRVYSILHMAFCGLDNALDDLDWYATGDEK